MPDNETDKPVYIDGFGFSGFRSFSNSIQYIGPFSKINFMIGGNNSGKSNILKFISTHLSTALVQMKFKCDGMDVPSKSESPSAFALAISKHCGGYQEVLDRIQTNPDALHAFEAIVSQESLTRSTDLLWFTIKSEQFDKDLLESLMNIDNVTRDQLNAFYYLNTNQKLPTSSETPAARAREIKLILHYLLEDLKKYYSPVSIKTIPDCRYLSKEGGDITRGAGITDLLFRLQNPPLTSDEVDSKKFQNINEFLRDILGNKTAKISVPHTKDSILIEIGGKKLPIQNLGTGVTQAVILAAIITDTQNSIVCIEEPETNLHPLMLKALVKYMQEETSNQYFITTHSSAVLNIPFTEVFHVRLDSNQSSVVERAVSKQQKSDISSSLGLLQSDLMMANYIVWVEGPSDRIYLKHWITSVNPNLIEGLHYSIMIYGGKLLSNFTAAEGEILEKEDEERESSIHPDLSVDEFIDFRSLNRYGSILMDSDKKSSSSKVNDTKLRMQDAFDTDHGFAWITDGREIENYIKLEVLEQAVTQVHSNATKLANNQRYQKILEYFDKDGELVQGVGKKKEIARKVIEHPADLSVLDLREKVEKLVAFIEKANGIKSSTES